MKKIIISLAAVAAFVGCAKESTPTIERGESLSLTASINLDDTRVTVEGETFTDVKWEQDDAIALSSANGASATLKATAAGDTDIRFEGEGTLVADVDTYYAVYPMTAITAGVVTFDLAQQAGDDAAILVAKSENTAKDAIDMSFKPANALLHVVVSGVESLAKAEFKAFDGSAIATTFSYDIANDTASATGSSSAIVVENPAVSGFFFSLPADLNMENGYVVTLTDASGNVCSKAYNGKTFARGTTTRVDIAWSIPSVTLGAKTSYSYYLLNQPASANSCANNVIYFTGDCATTYACIQNAFISEVGFIVDGTTYSSTDGAVTWNKSSKSFSMSNMSVSEWRGYSVEAYVVTSTHGTIKSSSTLYITGLPYALNPAANDSTYAWVANNNGNVTWNNGGSVRIGYNVSSWTAATSTNITKSFVLPADLNVVVNASLSSAGSGSNTWLGDARKNTTFTLSVSDNSIYSYTTTNGSSTQNHTCSNKSAVMTSATPTVKCHNSYSTATGCSNIYSLTVNYGNK